MSTEVRKGKTKQSDEERKEKDRIRNKAYRQTPGYKAHLKKNNARPEIIAKEKARRQTPEHKAVQKAYRDRPENKAKKKERAQSPEYKAVTKKNHERPENVAKSKERQKRPENKAKKKNTRDDRRLKILQYYSKDLSKSDIPCCNCCGLNVHMDFLDIDHIAGKNQMDSESELTKLGYSSKLKGMTLHKFLIDNDFPKGFQILCKNCNVAKGMKRNNNKCPMENKPHTTPKTTL